MAGRICRVLFGFGIALAALVGHANAQPLGTYSWQLAPFCNIVTLNATQNGLVYTLDGYDNQCGSDGRASASGMAFLNPNGSIGIGLTIVTSPSGTPVHVESTISLSTLGGTWHDNHGNTGTFIFTPSGSGSGSPRPLSNGEIPNGSITEVKLADGAVTAAKIVDGTIGAQEIDPGQVQQRIQSQCPGGQVMIGVNQNGTVVCVTSGAGGDITGVVAGTGLAGGGTSGEVTLNLRLSGTGSTNAAAHSDHTHGVGGVSSGNTVIGELAFGSPGFSANTTAIGYRAGFGGGDRNTAVGSRALNADTAGQDNTAVGDQALALAGGSNHTAVGAGALGLFTTGQNNVALGSDALANFVSGSSNIAIGRQAGFNLTSGDSNLYVGNFGNATEDNTIRIGTAGHTRTFVGGVRGVTTGVNNAVPVVIDAAGQLGTVSSSRRTKFDVASLEPSVASALQRLRPVQFRYRQAFADDSTPIQYGLIAEEVNDVLPELVALGPDGTPETVKYHVLPSLLLADVQRLERERQRLEAALARETARVSDLERRLDALQSDIHARWTSTPGRP